MSHHTKHQRVTAMYFAAFGKRPASDPRTIRLPMAEEYTITFKQVAP